MGVFRTSHSREVLNALIEWRNVSAGQEQQVPVTVRMITEISLPIITAFATAEGCLFGVSIIFTGLNGAERTVDCVTIACKSIFLMLLNLFANEV